MIWPFRTAFCIVALLAFSPTGHCVPMDLLVAPKKARPTQQARPTKRPRRAKRPRQRHVLPQTQPPPVPVDPNVIPPKALLAFETDLGLGCHRSGCSGLFQAGLGGDFPAAFHSDDSLSVAHYLGFRAGALKVGGLRWGGELTANWRTTRQHSARIGEHVLPTSMPYAFSASIGPTLTFDTEPQLGVMARAGVGFPGYVSVTALGGYMPELNGQHSPFLGAALTLEQETGPAFVGQIAFKAAAVTLLVGLVALVCTIDGCGGAQP